MTRATPQRLVRAASLAIGGLAALAGCGTIFTAPDTTQLRPAQATQARLAAPSERPRRFGSGCSSEIVYAASYNNTIQIYNQKGNPTSACGSISGLNNPQGMFVDASLNLWVVNAGTKQVFEFAPGAQQPSLTLTDPGGSPDDVAVDNASGTVYVTNFFSGNGSGPGNVEVYPAGDTSPTMTLTDPSNPYIFYDAVDNKGNLYVTYLGSDGRGHIDEWKGGSGNPNELGMLLQAPGGILTGKSGALVVCDQSAKICGQFNKGKKTLTNSFAATDSDPFALALNAKENVAFVGDAGSGYLESWKFPGGAKDKKPLWRIQVAGGMYAGVATSPAPPEGKPY